MDENTPAIQTTEFHRGATQLIGAATLAHQIGFLRLSQILGDPDARPPIPALVPIKKSAWWDWCRTGRAPKPVKIANGVTAWRASEIFDLVERIARGEPIGPRRAGGNSSITVQDDVGNRGVQLAAARRARQGGGKSANVAS